MVPFVGRKARKCAERPAPSAVAGHAERQVAVDGRGQTESADAGFADIDDRLILQDVHPEPGFDGEIRRGAESKGAVGNIRHRAARAVQHQVIGKVVRRRAAGRQFVAVAGYVDQCRVVVDRIEVRVVQGVARRQIGRVGQIGAAEVVGDFLGRAGVGPHPNVVDGALHERRAVQAFADLDVARIQVQRHRRRGTLRHAVDVKLHVGAVVADRHMVPAATVDTGGRGYAGAAGRRNREVAGRGRGANFKPVARCVLADREDGIGVRRIGQIDPGLEGEGIGARQQRRGVEDL